ncbi:unnamed protein product [Larinioides sclopetarius]|uniref:Caspase activity and apoptosis inhibitor 1 n=1 Tax=Larinioides sclopetarius TaxID=280406 RepID=A0AAV1Z500_9ARAC
MESRPHTSSKRKSGSPNTEVKSKRSTSSPKQETKAKKKDAENKYPQKTRWEPLRAVSSAQPVIQVNASKEEEQKSHQHHQRIKDLLENKEKIVEYLFLTVTGTALQELIPDYLKKRSIEELKILCETEIQKIPQEEILQIISGKYRPPEEKAKSAINEADELCATKDKNPVKEKPETKLPAERSSSIAPSPETTESFSNDVLELNPSSNEMKCITDEENQAPISIEEVAKDLYASEKDADIIELEMRARCIMSLLKAKGQNSPDSDSRDVGEEE